MTQNRKIRFGVVGFGHIGKRHAEEIAKNERAELAAIADISSKALEEAGQYDCRKFNSFEEMIGEMEALDVVSICTPNGLHISQAKAVVGAGMHVLVEKPLGLKVKDCRDLITKAQEKNKEVFCVLQNRYSPHARFLKDFIGSNKLGDIYWIDVACYWNRDHRYYTQDGWRGTLDLDGGTLFTQFSHFVDLLYWIFGPIQPTAGVFANFNHHHTIDFEDTGSFHFDLPNKNTKGIFSYSTSVHQKNLESSITVIGSMGSIRLGGQYMNSIDYFEVEGEQLPNVPPGNPPNNYGAYQGSAANHGLVIENIIRALNGDQAEIPRAEEAMVTVDIIEQVYSLRKL